MYQKPFPVVLRQPVTGHSKGSQSVSSLITNSAFDPIYERALGMDMVTACAHAGKVVHIRTQGHAQQTGNGIGEETMAIAA